MRKFLTIFFWSHGTLLGYLGSLSQKGLPEIFSKWVLINLSNPLRHPAPLVDPLLTKKLDTAGPWCGECFIKMRAAFLAHFLPELWRTERARRELSFWWKTLILIEHYGMARGFCVYRYIKMKSTMLLN